MIKLFRNIRQKLVAEGKTTNYLKYAIGEIILVMIGILLALQVNNWNEQRKNKHIEYEMLSDLKSDLEETNKDILDDIEGNQFFLNSTLNIQRHILENLTFHDSLIMDFDIMTQQTTLFEKSSAYESLKSSGLNIISNNKIKKEITDFFNLKLARAQSTSKLSFNEIFMPYLEKHFDVNLDATLMQYWYEGGNRPKGSLAKGNLPGYVPLDYVSLKSDPKFSIILRNAINARINIIGRYTSTSKSIDNLINLIDDELKTMKN